ncbi:hypothetical protein EJ994_01920 [Maribacter sp. MJ134]|uniref:hypothetical protein n=1 Tax=Maribacter sp. MJ134 TaxID=2496865 RepID=UPI000F830F11|nr:hypothetical protein [Maribacter sp. MJ134]AZQ57620.1 hypothetical protein EJ994_01920 [Maribacter sp. MJ134]
MENIITNTPFSVYEARIKLLVLHYSLAFEDFASSSLRIILNLDEENESLGNTSKALSMNQKVQLMLDSKLFDKNDRENIITFMSIRNQFMHNSSAKSFESCLSFLTGKANYITKAYNTSKKADEKACGEKAAKLKKDEEINDKELLLYDVSDTEKLLFKSWIFLASTVIKSFEKVLKIISEERKLIKLDGNKSIYLNFPKSDSIQNVNKN